MNIEEYKRKKFKTFITGEGLKVTVKVLTSPLPFVKLLKKHGLEKPENLAAEELLEKSEAFQKELFEKYVVSPKIGEELAYEDIFDVDRAEIQNAIVEKLQWFRFQPTRTIQKPNVGGSHSRWNLP